MTDVIVTEINGLSALVQVPTLHEDLPAEILEGLTRRRLVYLGQPCPCGARPFSLNREQRRRLEARRRKGLPVDSRRGGVEHDKACPATNENLLALAAEHGVPLERLR